VRAARIDAADEGEHALVLLRSRRPVHAVEPFALERAAKAPEEAPAERQMAPGRQPMHAFLDGVRAHLVVHGFPDGHRTIDEQLMAPVIDVAQAPEDLVLRELVKRRKDVLVQPERVLAEGEHAQCDRALGDLDLR
jgi:hypothetical protein